MCMIGHAIKLHGIKTCAKIARPAIIPIHLKLHATFKSMGIMTLCAHVPLSIIHIHLNLAALFELHRAYHDPSNYLCHVDHSASQFLRDNKALYVECQLALVGGVRRQLEWNLHSLVARATRLEGGR